MALLLKQFVFLVALFFTLTLPIYPQQYPFRNYLEKNGIPSPFVYSIMPDSRGYLWMYTPAGLCIFDGMEFKRIKQKKGLPGDEIMVMWEDRQGILWFGTNRGVVNYSQTKDFYRNPLLKSLNSTRVYDIREDGEGKIWLGTSTGLDCFDGKTLHHFKPTGDLLGAEIFFIALESKDKLWLGTNMGLGGFVGQKFINYSHQLQTSGNVVVTALLYDSTGTLWIGTPKGVKRFPKGRLTLHGANDVGVINHTLVTSLLEDRQGKVWVGTWEGCTLFSAGKFSTLTIQNGLPHNFIYDIAQDYEGNIWFGTHGGAGCLTSLNIKSYSKSEGLMADTLSDIIQDRQGRYWFGSSQGLWYDGGSGFKNVTTRDGLVGNSINDLLEDRTGAIWIATTQGLSVWSANRFTNFSKHDGLGSNILFKLYQSRDGTIWIGHKMGISLWQRGKFLKPPFVIPPTAVFSIVEDKNDALWFSANNKLYRYWQKGLTAITTGDIYGSNDSVSLLADRQNRIWIASNNGLSVYQDGKINLIDMGTCTLPDKACFFLLLDRENRIWSGNSSGLLCFDGNRFTSYSTQRLGLTDRMWVIGLQDNQGRMWFGSTAGVTTFNPPPISALKLAPPVHMTGIKIMEKDAPLTPNPSLDYQQNIFRFSFAGISFSAPGEVRYKYRLENLQKEWLVTRERSLFYPFLPPGSYNFQVKALNADGMESQAPAEYAFTIPPPFWQTWWFRLLLGVSGLFFLLLGIQWRVRRARERAEQKARAAELALRNRQLVTSQRMELMGTLAAGTVHDLKNLLSVIIDYSREVGEEYQGDENHNHNVKVIKDTATTAAQLAKQILSFARPKFSPNEPVELVTVLSEILDTLKVMQPTNIKIKWEPPSESIFFPIHPGRLQQLVMNLCINAFHAMPRGGELRVSLTLKNEPEQRIILEVADSGIGITPENINRIFEPLFSTKEYGEGTGLGLFVVKQVVAENNGNIQVFSQPQQGTRFVISFPYA